MTRVQNETTSLLIGCAAGFSGDRIDAAQPVVRELVRQSKPAFLIFETLAERTLALAQLARRQNPDAGYEPLMVEFLRPVLADCLAHGIRIVSNFGAANPQGAAWAIAALAKELGTRPPQIAVVHGDDLSGPAHCQLLEKALGSDMPDQQLVSANAYIGARPIARPCWQVQTLWCAAASPTPHWWWALPWPTSAGPGMTGIAWPEPR